MTSFRWLHLTDLHRGLEPQGWLLPNIKNLFFEDLRKLHDKCGPWDVVFFTGDLTQRGSPEEFIKLTETLEELWAHLKILGSVPYLLAVPGNHDLARPSAQDPAVVALNSWTDEVQKEFWKSEESSYRKTVTQAFAAYSNWWESHRFPRPSGFSRGVLPGEFSVILEKEGFRLGVAGLNSAFLQLTGGDYLKKLALDVRQFPGVRGDGENVRAWMNRSDLCFLMTHHPPAWLSPKAQEELNSEIAPPGEFALHLFGHMHDHSATQITVGGGAARRYLQGCALFAMEKIEGSSPDRRHGYSAGIITREGNTSKLRLWPRTATRHETEHHWRLQRDQNRFDNLCDDDGTQPEEIRLRTHHQTATIQTVLSTPPPAANLEQDPTAAQIIELWNQFKTDEDNDENLIKLLKRIDYGPLVEVNLKLQKDLADRVHSYADAAELVRSAASYLKSSGSSKKTLQVSDIIESNGNLRMSALLSEAGKKGPPAVAAICVAAIIRYGGKTTNAINILKEILENQFKINLS